MKDNDTRLAFSLYADLISYPQGISLEAARTAAGHLLTGVPEAAREMEAFLDSAATTGVEGLEEIYTRTFDITPTTNAYAGYHLFGESYKRGLFLVRLQEEYRKHGFSAGSELPDHLGVILRFLGLAADQEFVQPLLGECLLPMAEKMEADFKDADNGYKHLIGSLKCFLGQQCRETANVGGL
ncbi:MAG: nitrate reductase molybdenum cofactor assembly chaperone [Chloroflexi bacterium]|nr:nitrate reductase molybdenum cofactor assembly chaperone [Chloroflexota bacterium]